MITLNNKMMWIEIDSIHVQLVISPSKHHAMFRSYYYVQLIFFQLYEYFYKSQDAFY